MTTEQVTMERKKGLAVRSAVISLLLLISCPSAFASTFGAGYMGGVVLDAFGFNMVAGPDTPHNLFSKFTNNDPTETGLGLVGGPDNEAVLAEGREADGGIDRTLRASLISSAYQSGVACSGERQHRGRPETCRGTTGPIL